MAESRRLRIFGARTFAIGSIVGVLLGLALIGIGGRTFTTIGVIAIIIAAISLLLSVGSYLGGAHPDEE